MKKVLLLIFFTLSFFGQASYSQNVLISGQILSDEMGGPLSGVDVLVKGTTRRTVSDMDGRYTIQASANETLVFSFIGFVSQEFAVGSASTINVTLNSDAKTIGEVVEVGYGSTTKGDLTVNIASVKGDALATVPVPNFQEALHGRLAGVFVESSNGKLGEGVKIRVRGTTSISGGNDPLYVIDGIPMTTTGAIGLYNPLSDINFNDIESFEVLKDASAAAIYGARAANGVVLITTRSGAKGKTKFNVGIQRGVSSPTRLREFLNTSEYIELMREAGNNYDRRVFGTDPLNNPADYPGSELQFVDREFDILSGWSEWRTGETDTDWQKQAFNPNAGTLNVNFSASGGDEKTRFFFSGAYDKQDGILIRNDFERVSSRLRLDHNLNNRFLIGGSFYLARVQNNKVSNDLAFNNPMQLVALAPITPIRDLNGQLYDRPTTTYYNNLIDSENAEWLNTSFRNITNIYGEYRLRDDLRFRSEFGVDIMNQNEEQFFGSRTNVGLSTNGNARSRWTRIFNYNTNNYFTYTKNFADKHDLEAIAGMSFQKSDQYFTFVEGQEFPFDELRTLASAAEIIGGSSSVTNFSFLSYFTRVNYKYAGKYLATLSARIDGSSRFGENNKYGFFPAASVGWILSEEGFLKGNEKLSLLKLRASYGLTGNSEIGDFNHLGIFGATNYGTASGIVPTIAPNPNLTWENTTQLNLGLEFSLFNDRITGEVDLYDKNTSGLLLNVPVPTTSGFNIQRQNVGRMQNYGMEIVLNSVNVARQDFTWNTSFNFARNINRVRELAPGQTSIPPASSRFLNGVFIGQSIGVFYGPAYAGVDPANGDALYYTNAERTETTNNYNEAERQFVGDPNPKFFGGITNNLTYKNFDLSILFQGVYGNDIFDAGNEFHSSVGFRFDNSTRDQLRRWQNPGDITDVPQSRLGLCNGCRPSSRFISDGSYLRLRTLTFGYNIPKAQLERFKVNSMRVFFTGQNLLTLTNYKGWDPEVNTDYIISNILSGNNFYSAPQTKTFSLGINVGF
ncbi:TonB-linked outer membrane protein, SusC/RagA family [Belliella buryatensis]|uniref:TonB-linked outer membrane protein, SusC/RagA family n=1 Tax=Belliella buryatensis TaxID=1500549 RepID=A0A239DQI7_9BACT|nr:TonB-dependent receptor [Belliella buryatensis]SNS34770.1 TonB-linked outer membrane protein, SusC/RagA family [Belliella buryatensis]